MKNCKILIPTLAILWISCQKREAMSMETEVNWQNIYKIAQKYDCVAEAEKHFKPSFDKGVITANDLTYYDTWFSNTKQIKDMGNAQNNFRAKVTKVKSYEDYFSAEDEYCAIDGSTPFTKIRDAGFRQKMLDGQFNIYYDRRDTSVVIIPIESLDEPSANWVLLLKGKK